MSDHLSISLDFSYDICNNCKYFLSSFRGSRNGQTFTSCLIEGYEYSRRDVYNKKIISCYCFKPKREEPVLFR